MARQITRDKARQITRTAAFPDAPVVGQRVERDRLTAGSEVHERGIGRGNNRCTIQMRAHPLDGRVNVTVPRDPIDIVGSASFMT